MFPKTTKQTQLRQLPSGCFPWASTLQHHWILQCDRHLPNDPPPGQSVAGSASSLAKSGASLPGKPGSIKKGGVRRGSLPLRKKNMLDNSSSKRFKVKLSPMRSKGSSVFGVSLFSPHHCSLPPVFHVTPCGHGPFFGNGQGHPQGFGGGRRHPAGYHGMAAARFLGRDDVQTAGQAAQGL